jgi:hypothetical protein
METKFDVCFTDGKQIQVTGESLVDGLERAGFSENILKDILNWNVAQKEDVWETNHCV